MSLKVHEYMISPVLSLNTRMKLREVAEFFLAHKISGAPVVDESNHVLSIMGMEALVKLAATEGVEATMAHCLSKLTLQKDLVTLHRDADFQEAYKLFLKHNIHRIPIVDGNNKLTGMISRGAVLRVIVEAHYGKKLPK